MSQLSVSQLSVADYLKSERQWPRECRVRRAAAELRAARAQDQREFWRAVLKALEK